MRRTKLLAASFALAALSGSVASAGTFKELTAFFNQNDVNIDIAVTGDYLFTADRNDEIGGESGYEDRFGYAGYFAISKEATEKSPLGFKVAFGNEYAPVVGIEPLPSADNQVKLHEAYVEAKFANFDIMAGRILTNIGGEAAYTWENYNIQRGLVWNGEPVFYNGVRVSAEFGRFGVYAGVNDRDTSDGKMAVEAGISTQLPYKTSVSLNALVPDSKDENPTKVVNLTFNIDYLPNLPITFYADYLSTPQAGQDAQSVGLALLTDYKFNKQISVGARVEYVNNDGDGDNYGIGVGNNAVTFTVTPKYQINKYLYIRGEASYVKLGNKYYVKKNDGTTTDTEFRLGAEIGFVF